MLLIGFANNSFTLYTIDLLEEIPFKVLITFKLTDTSSSCLVFHNSKPVICSGNKANSLSVWDYRGKNFLISQKSLDQEITAYSWN